MDDRKKLGAVAAGLINLDAGAGVSWVRDTSGLLFREQFLTEGESVPGWTDDDAAAGNDWQVVNGVLVALGTYLFRDIPGWGSNFMLSWNEDFASAADSNQMLYKGDGITVSDLGADWHRVIVRQVNNDGRIYDSTTLKDTEAESIVLDEMRGLRVIHDGTTHTMLWTAALASMSDLDLDFAAFGGGLTFAGATARTGTQLCIVCITQQEYDNLTIQGNTIVINGVPDGHKVQIDSRTAIAETAGSVTFPLSTIQAWALPATSLQLLDAGDATVGAAFSPTGPTGVFGGDIYTVSV